MSGIQAQWDIFPAIAWEQLSKLLSSHWEHIRHASAPQVALVSIIATDWACRSQTLCWFVQLGIDCCVGEDGAITLPPTAHPPRNPSALVLVVS